MAPTAVAGGVLMGVAYTRGVPFAAARAVEWIVEHQHELRTLWSTYGVGAVVLATATSCWLVSAALGYAWHHRWRRRWWKRRRRQWRRQTRRWRRRWRALWA